MIVPTLPMERDVDKIIELLKQEFPSLKVVQLEKVHPADDDGLWWYRLPGMTKDIQIESPSGNCPFLIESDDDKSSKDALIGLSIADVVERVSAYLRSLA